MLLDGGNRNGRHALSLLASSWENGQVWKKERFYGCEGGALECPGFVNKVIRPSITETS